MTIWIPEIKKYPGPAYKALAKAIADDVKAGRLKPNDKLPPQRQLADELGVTVGTITRGYAEAEKQHLIVARMGSGTFVGGSKNGMADYLKSIKSDEGLIDLSLSTTLSHGQEKAVSSLLADISADKELLAHLIRYESEAGIPHQKSIISNWLNELNVPADKENMIICNGGQNALSTVLSALTIPGDKILSESLTYPGFTHLAKLHQLKHFGVQMDQWGLIPESLESLCHVTGAKILYCIPNHQNPMATTLPEERRHEVAEIVRRNNLLILEDQVQGILHGECPPSLKSLAPDRVIYCGSFSKVFAGGVRVGYILSPQRYLNSLVSAFYLNCLFASPIMIEVVCQAIQSGMMSQLIGEKKEILKERNRIFAGVFQKDDVNYHHECLHAWLNLPECWDPEDFVLQLQRNGVLVKGTKSFSVEKTKGTSGIRICLTAPERNEDVENGLKEIKKTLDQQPGVWQSIM